jgi:predicted nucleic acid-binding protein
MILIDSDVLIDIVRDFPPAVQWLQSVAPDVIRIPGYVMMELIDGCHNKAQLRQLDQITTRMPVVWPSPASCTTAMFNFRALHLSHSLGLLDSLIAQTAVELALPLHTFNVKHFQHVPGLTTIQPYTR